MHDHGISERVRQLILSSIPSVLQLEIVLRLYQAGPRFVPLKELSGTLGIDPASLEQQLGDLQRRGMVARQDHPEPLFAYAKSFPQQDEAVEELARAYQSHRVSVINLIYSRPTEKIRTFADAFRLRQDDQEHPHE